MSLAREVCDALHKVHMTDNYGGCECDAVQGGSSDDEVTNDWDLVTCYDCVKVCLKAPGQRSIFSPLLIAAERLGVVSSDLISLYKSHRL